MTLLATGRAPSGTKFTLHSTLLLAAIASLAGCALTPNFQRPASPEAAAFAKGQPPSVTVATAGVPGGEAQRFLAGKPLPARWWTLFGSEALNNLVQRALAGSPSLVAAQAALRSAEQQALASRAGLFPSIDANGSATRQKIDTGSFGNPGGGSFIYNLFNANVKVSYGLDLFGGTARGVEAQLAASDVVRFQSEAAYQTLIANVVNSAVQQALVRGLIDGQNSVIAGQEQLLSLAEKQLALGAISRTELLALQASLAQERAKLPELRNSLGREQTRLAIYLGKLPSEMAEVELRLTDLKLPQELPISLPSDLVRQRPDVLAAEARLHQAQALLGVAAANRWPSLNLTASYGSQSSKLEDLFSGDVWSLGAGLTAPIFRAGELGARQKVAEADLQQADAQYRQTVLQSFGEVGDALRQLASDAELLQAQVAASKAADAVRDLTTRQLKLGAANTSQRILADQQYTQSRSGAARALAARYQDTVALFLALGGGFNAPAEAATHP